MQQTDVELLAEAAVIAEETTAGANTADRIGTMLENIIDSKVNNLDVVSGTVLTTKVTLSSAEILALNSTPKTLIAAPGSGKLIRVLSIVEKLNYGSATYATNILQQFRYTGTTTVIANNSLLGSTENTIAEQLASTAVTYSTATSDPVNKAVELTVQTGNPTTGDGTLDVYVTYTVITL